MYDTIIILACLILPLQSFAQTRQLESHEHGTAQFLMVMEGEKLQIQLEVPSESLVGFEHFPETEKDREVFASTMTNLSNPSNLLGIPEEAECLPVGINVFQTLFPGDDKHRDDHDRSKSDKDHDHEKSGTHKEQGEEVHSEFHASYLWNCHHMDDLDSIQTRLIKVFPRIEELRVQWIVEDLQGAMELENQDGVIRGWR